MLPDSIQRLKDNIARIIIGKEDVLELLLVSLVTDSHILIEDVPGVGKTLITKALAASLSVEFNRLQCTPDLSPANVTGFNIFDREKNTFVFMPGPVLTNILLVDEINRAVPRTQSSLLEAMEERQITVDGDTIKLPSPFMVIATQNPIEHEGTFPLPEAQLDRFMLKISMGYPDIDEEKMILATHGSLEPLLNLQSVAGQADIIKWKELLNQVFISESIINYIVELVRATRQHSAVSFGASPRATLALYRASRALAMLRGRQFVIPDDVKYIAKFVLVHRISLKREERLRGTTASKIVLEILEMVQVPMGTGDE